MFLNCSCLQLIAKYYFSQNHRDLSRGFDKKDGWKSDAVFTLLSKFYIIGIIIKLDLGLLGISRNFD
jgi:hypothetical protein